MQSTDDSFFHLLLKGGNTCATQWTIQFMEFSRPEYWSGQPLSPGDPPKPRIEPRSPALQVDSLPAEPQGKPNNTRVGSLSLLQGIFPTQALNWGLLHCRRILYQLNYQGSQMCVYIYMSLCGCIHAHIQNMFAYAQMIPGKIPKTLGTTVVSYRGVRGEKGG